MKFNQWFMYIVLALIVIGIVYQMSERPFSIIIPIVVIGGIVLLIKYPPAFLRGNSASSRKSTKQEQHVKVFSSKASKVKKDRPRSKTVPFKVIDGGREDNDTPRYH